MVLVKRLKPDILLGFAISNITKFSIDQTIADFKLGSFDEYDPMVKLSLDQTRFIGFSPEKVRDQLDAEDVRESFILLDAETTQSKSVWWVGRYLDEEMESVDADRWRQMCVVNVSSDERILMKARFATVEVPMFHVNHLISNMDIFDIFDNIPLPIDPHGPQEPYSIFDWEHNPPPPPPASVVASPEEYEKSSEAAVTQNFVLGAGALTEVVRLKEDVARENNLQSEWTTVSVVPQSEEGYPEGSLSFTQPWAFRK